MFEESELINLALSFLWLTALAYLRRSVTLPKLPFLYAGVSLIICGYVFTLLEEAAFFETFNLLEHLCFAGAGVLIAIECRRLARAGFHDDVAGMERK
jgi:hypothetical protein